MSNEKYPRTFHLPWSAGSTSDDKRLSSVDQFLSSPNKNIRLIMTEKLDGSNSCLMPQGVYARTHSKIAQHASFNLLKARHASIKHLLRDDEQIFGENCFAVHSIIYGQLPDVFFVFGIKRGNTWLSHNETVHRAHELGLSMAPLLFDGIVISEKRLENLCNIFMKQPSHFGGEREGLVIRLADAFIDDNFSRSLGKCVRANHVQTDEHWMLQPICPQKIVVNQNISIK